MRAILLTCFCLILLSGCKNKEQKDNIDNKTDKNSNTAIDSVTIDNSTLEANRDIFLKNQNNDKNRFYNVYSLLVKYKGRPCIDLIEEGLVSSGIDKYIAGTISVIYDDIYYIAKDPTVLHIASGCGYYDIVEELILSGADVNIQDSQGYPPIVYSISSSNIEVLKVLISHQADVYGYYEGKQVLDYLKEIDNDNFQEFLKKYVTFG